MSNSQHYCELLKINYAEKARPDNHIEAPLDIEYALTTMGDDYDTLKMILTMMLDEQMSADQAEIEQAYAKQDWDAVEKIAHRMKGGFLCCGTQRLVYASQYLERYRKAGHSKELDHLYQQLLFVIQETMPVIKDWLDKNE